ncbi:hypothetical protein SS50377_25198 [Spironucleus salmonicida]|uniref:Uncharacterized protein n=1 Tax=Spironucleus salmonicida TaxID=348837 RepID=V6M113_9EUKA|nr:hypothetical protein SS50377_25198 [Spironucleus salmonicida]|eukprot:EST46854.1 Hypothetical protein SS50377_13117 [Spironucleus salmonicida]
MQSPFIDFVNRKQNTLKMSRPMSTSKFYLSNSNTVTFQERIDFDNVYLRLSKTCQDQEYQQKQQIYASVYYKQREILNKIKNEEIERTIVKHAISDLQKITALASANRYKKYQQHIPGQPYRKSRDTIEQDTFDLGFDIVSVIDRCATRKSLNQSQTKFK